MSLSEKQVGVLRGIAPALVITLATLVISVLMSSSRLLAADEYTLRMWLVGAAYMILATCLMAPIMALARHRFFSAADIDGSGLSGGSADAQIRQAILQNTLEQVVLAALVYAMCALLLPIGWLGVVPAAAVLFAVGRVFFWCGYAGGAPSRALGFGLTFYPSVSVFVLAIVSLMAGPR